MITVLLIAVSLSMDAFSLSLVYGTLNINKKNILLQSIIVGIYHFMMPLLGNIIGERILLILTINPKIVVFVVLFIIGLQMIMETFREEKIKNLNIKEMILFGFAVSLDSLSIGLGLKTIYDNIIFSIVIFMIVSFTFTYIGLSLGKKINDVTGKISTIMGGIILMIVGLLYII